MANQIEIPVKINVDKAKKDLEDLRNRIRELNAAGDDNEEIVKQLEKEYDRISDMIEKATKAIENNTKEQSKAAKSSNLLQRAFGGISSSVGDLASKLEAIPGPVGQVAQGITGLVKGFNAIISSGIGIALTAIVGAFSAWKAVMSSTEEGQLKLAEKTGKLKGVIIGLKEVLVQIGPLIGDIFSGNWSKLAKDWENVKNAFSNIGNVAEQTGEISKARKKMAKETAEWALQESKLNGELEKQRTIAEDQSKSEAERSKANKAVYDTQKKIIEGNLKLKQKEIALMKQEQSLSSNTQEDNIALIELQKQEQDLINQLDKVNTDYIKKQNQIAKKGKKDAAEEEKAAKEEFERTKRNNANLITLQKQRLDALKTGSKEWLDEQAKLIQLTYNADIYAAQGDETLKKIAEGKREAAEKAAKEAGDAYVKAQEETLAKLNDLVSPDLDKTKWDKMRSDLQKELDSVEKQIADALANQNITADQAAQLRTQLEERESQKRKDIEEDEANYKKELYRNAADSIIGGLLDITAVNAEQSKAMFNANKALQIAQATIEGARGAIKIFADETAPTAVKVAEAAALGATTAATIAKISKTKFGGSSSGGGQAVQISTAKGASAAVNDQIITRGVRDDSLRTKVQTVLVLSDVEAKQKQVNRVKVESRI